MKEMLNERLYCVIEASGTEASPAVTSGMLGGKNVYHDAFELVHVKTGIPT